MSDDSRLYSESKEYVIRQFSDIYNLSEDCVIVSISRKGPKLLEYLLGRKDGGICNTITEVALPFYMYRISSRKKPKRIIVFDDAIYFGTTVEGIYKDIASFERLYDLSIDKELYTAIRSRESKSELQLGDVSIHSYNDDYGIELRQGYGHFFIKNLEKDLSKLNNTLEVEFPVVEFKTAERIDKEKLSDVLKEYYEENLVFEVRHYDKTSLSIVLDDKGHDTGQSFRKLRIYVDDNIIRLVCMAPWVLPNDMSALSRLFDYSKFRDVWMSLVNAYAQSENRQKNFKADYFLSIERCIRKSLVIVANYILSFRLILEERMVLTKIFDQVASNISYDGIKESDLFYLIGDLGICREIKKRFDTLWYQWGLPGGELIPNMKLGGCTIDYQVFENENFPEREELDIFRKHNKEMLESSRDINEALSAMFFNQTSLIEKWSRRSEIYDFGRLRFGYTYSSLYRALIASDKMGHSLEDRKVVNQWMDHRIDQACVVPQYVVDKRTNQWCRVFRPGENEDALLSHMARYVLSIFKIVEKAQGLGWVYKDFLNEMLCLSAMSSDKEWLKNSFEFELMPDIENRVLKFRYEGQERVRDVMTYMLDMRILKEGNGMISISEELADDEIGKATTLDSNIITDIHNRLSVVTVKIVDYKYQNYPFFVTNLYFFKEQELDELKQLNQLLTASLTETIQRIEQTGEGQSHAQQLFREYYQTKKYIVGPNMLVDTGLMASLFPEDGLRKAYIREILVLWMAKSICEMLIVSYLRDRTDDLVNEVESSLTTPLVYGYSLGMSQDEAKRMKGLIDQQVGIVRLREAILPIVKNHLAGIPQVKI